MGGIGCDNRCRFAPRRGFKSLLLHLPLKTLDRHRLDRIARAVVTGERGLGRDHDEIADRAASMISNRLEAHSVAGAKATRSRISFTSRSSDPAVLELVLSRVDKHLAFAALPSRDAGAKPHRSRPR